MHDQTNITAARAHLPHIAKMFGDGDFSAPVHRPRPTTCRGSSINGRNER